MRSKYILIVLSVVAALAAMAVAVSAGNPDNPPGPPETTSLYTLEYIYDRLTTGADGTQSTFTEPSEGPPTGTMHTLNEIMSVAPAVDDTNGAAQTHVLAGMTACGPTSGEWGVITGTMPDNGVVTIVPTTTNQTIAAGYHDGSGYVEGDADLVADNIKQGVNLFGVDGTLIGGSTYEAGVPKTGQTISYTVGDDGDLQMGVAWPDPRFTDNGNGTVTDELTGLIWLKDANCAGRKIWSEAVSWANGLYDGCTDCGGTNDDCGLSDGSVARDWRLPNVRELQSLIDYGEHSPALPDGHPFTGVQTGFHHASTTCADSTDRVLGVSLRAGFVYYAPKYYFNSVWPVRGGQNGAAQTHVLAGMTACGPTSGEWGVITGTMPDNGVVTIVPTTTNQTIAAGYHDGSGYVEGDADLVADNIKQGVNLFGVDGTLIGGSTYEAGVPKTGQTISYTVGDDGDLQMGVAWPDPRFTDNGNGTVTDELTGLIWLKDANCAGRKIWSEAVSWANGLYDGCTDCGGTNDDCGLSDGSVARDWRLPNVRELQSLIDYGEHGPALPDGHPFTGVQSDYYHASTTCADYTGSIWGMSLHSGYVYYADKSSLNPVWPVKRATYNTYLPLVLRNYVVAPDLVVERIVATSNDVQVVIANRGNAPVTDDFWVDVYLDPDPAPNGVNQVWYDGRSAHGAVWGVTEPALPQLAPGGVLTLTLGDAYYSTAFSRLPDVLPAGTPVYVQVDAVNLATTYGGVLENHEITGGVYNNIASTVSTLAVAGEPPSTTGGNEPPGSSDRLPPRP